MVPKIHGRFSLGSLSRARLEQKLGSQYRRPFTKRSVKISETELQSDIQNSETELSGGFIVLTESEVEIPRIPSLSGLTPAQVDDSTTKREDLEYGQFGFQVR